MSNSKIDKALGITDIDDFLSDLSVDNDISSFQEIDDEVMKNVDEIDTQIQKYDNCGDIEKIDVGNIQNSLAEIKDLIDVSKMTIKHVYEQVTSMELIDSELVQALSKLMESTHIQVQEYINLYRDRMQFFDKMRLKQLDHQLKIMQMDHKHKLDMEKLEAKSEPSQVVENQMAFSQEDVISAIKEAEDNG